MNQSNPPKDSGRLKGLWLAREFPFPLDSGDRIYSARLIRSVVQAGAQLTLVGIPSEGGAALPTSWGVHCISVPGPRTSTARALLSPMPLVAAVHATKQYRALVEKLAKEHWDFVVIDQYGMGWALPYFAKTPGRRTPVLVHVAHDHEASVCRSLAKGYSGSWPRKLALWLNAFKTLIFERKIARQVDVLTAITEEDAQTFAKDAPGTMRLVLTPGYDGEPAPVRIIDDQVPNHVIMVGSYKWVAKEENLRKFVAVADPVFSQHGITLHIIGAMTEDMAAHVRATTQSTVVHGFVDDLAVHLRQARIAAVPEEIGGGFKLKFLDYIFGRVPVATLDHAAAGLPSDVRASLLRSDDLEGLVAQIVDNIQNDRLLHQLHEGALAAASQRYRWADRGITFVNAVLALKAA